VSAVTTRPGLAHRHGRPAGNARLGSRLLRASPGDPAWARPALLGLLLATAVLYLAGLSRSGYANEFYAAAVQAGTKSWKAFLFGSVDSSNFITVDKTPASLWVMELSGRLFGFGSWSLLAPQALEGVAAVGVLYTTVRRWFGPPAAIIAAAVLAVTPVATLMFRFDNPDALLVLVLTLTAHATTRAVESGRTRWVVLAGALLGLGYLTKMLQAFLALAVLLWLSRRCPRTDRTRAAALLWGGWLLVTGLVFSYMSGIIHPYYTVALAPAIGALVGIGAAGLWRIRHTWAARIVVAGTLLVTAAWSWALLDETPGWLPWLRVVIAAAATAAAALVLAGPALRAATASGAAVLAAAPVSLALVAGLAGPVAYSIDTAATAHGGSIPTAGPALTASAGGPGETGSPGFPGAAGGSTRSTGSPGRAGAGKLGRVGAGKLGRAGSVGSEGEPSGAGSPAGAGGGAPGGGVAGGGASVSSALSKLLESGASGYRWAAATVGSTSAASLELSSDGVPVMAIGGFTGSDPAPTLAEFEKLVADHEIHYFVGGGGPGGAGGPGGTGGPGGAGGPGGGSGYAEQITEWVRAHFTATTVGGTTVYDLTTPKTAS
jgi:4-amino-4-deoxy-L-arabinose transferase-like glycosyltransferase